MPILYIVSLLLISSIPTSLSGADNNLTVTAYDVLKQYNLPVGLLPRGVTNFTIDNSTNRFEVELATTCGFKIFPFYELMYGSRVTGVINKDRVTRLSGVKVKVYGFLWLSIREARHDGNDIEISVGFTDRDFPIENFDECATCGCGFDCLSGEVKQRNELNDINYVSAF